MMCWMDQFGKDWTYICHVPCTPIGWILKERRDDYYALGQLCTQSESISGTLHTVRELKNGPMQMLFARDKIYPPVQE